MRRWPRGQLSVAVFLAVVIAAEAFQDGDYVPVARRGQFSKVRTNWHDLLGRYCPRFGVNGMVVMPIPRPATGHEVDSYKLMLSIAGDRLYTHWMKLIGHGAHETPMLQVELTRAGNDIKSVTAQVMPVPATHMHDRLQSEWRNATAWPKHLLVEYRWRERHEVNAVPGLYLIFTTCMLAGLLLVVTGLAGSQDKLLEFAADMAAEEPLAGAAEPSTSAAPALDPAYRALMPKAD